MITKLPVPVPTHQVGVVKPNSETILNVYDQVENGKMYQSILHLMNGSLSDLDNGGLNALKDIPIINSEVIAIEAFKLYKLPTKLEGVYPCPRMGCNHKIIHEETKESDTRDDIAEMPITYFEGTDISDSYFTLHLDAGDEVKIYSRGDVICTISSITFRHPTIGDLISIENDPTLKKSASRLKKLYHSCIVSANFVSLDESITSVDVIKNRYPYEMLKFDDYRQIDRITVGLRKYGIYPFVAITCPNCGKEFEAAVDFTGFFAYALRSQLGERVKS